MAIVINGSGTVTGISVGGLPDGIVDAGTLATDSVDSAELIDGAVDASHLASISNRKNFIINGGFDVWQRGISFDNDEYGADRWKMYSPGSHAYARSTDVPTAASPRFKYSASITGSGDGTGFKQYIESANSSRLLGQDVTISFWLKHTTGSGTDKFKAQFYTLNTLDNGSSGTTIGSATLFTSTTSWAKYTTTFTDLPANTVNGLQLTLKYNGTGSTVALITGVQVELGSVATDFEQRSYGEELALCQRYYEIIGGTAAASYDFMFTGANWTTTNSRFGVQWNVTKRTSPTVTSVGTWYARNTSGASLSVTGKAFDDPSPYGVAPYVTVGSGLTAGYASQIWAADGKIMADAEL